MPGDSLPPPIADRHRSEEHTSELQSHVKLVCRLLLEKKNNVSPARTVSSCMVSLTTRAPNDTSSSLRARAAPRGHAADLTAIAARWHKTSERRVTTAC